MRDRVLFAAGAVARLVMVMVAFGLAVGSIGLASVRGFCPEVDEAGAAAVSLEAATLASVVEEPTEGAPPADPDASAPDPGATGAPADPGATDAPADQQTTTGEDGGEEAGACPGGAQRCLPPMVSSILIVGDPLCHDQAGGRLRAILVPAFVGSTALLAGAWWLRPSRLQQLIGSEPADRTT